MLLGALREQQQLRKSCFAGKLFIFEGSEPPKTRETRSRAQFPTEPHHIGLHGPDCNSNMQLGALRDQQQLWENCFLQMFVRRRLWKDAAPLKQRKQPNVRALRARLGSKRGCHGAGWCLPPRARSLEPSTAKCSKRDRACEMGRSAYAPANAPGGARATSPKVCVRWPPGAQVPATPCAHAAA